MRLKLAAIFLLLLVSVYLFSQKVTKTFLRKGNVYVQNGSNSFSQITKLGFDTLPILSHNKKFVIFLRSLPKQYDYVTQIVRFDFAIATETVLVKACTDNPRLSTPIAYADTHNYPFSCLGSIENIFISPNNQRIYFQAEAWTVSAAIHYYDMVTTKIHFFSNGSISRIFSNGMLDIEITGNEGNGRYWQHFLFDTNGKKITPALEAKTY